MSLSANPSFAVGVASGSGDESSLSKATSDDLVGHAKLLRDSLDRFPGLVTLVPVSNLRRVKYVGHVYNLSSKDEWYFANGIISHNCRCDVVPILDTETEGESQAASDDQQTSQN